jgi:hypothetical protein
MFPVFIYWKGDFLFFLLSVVIEATLISCSEPFLRRHLQVKVWYNSLSYQHTAVDVQTQLNSFLLSSQQTFTQMLTVGPPVNK